MDRLEAMSLLVAVAEAGSLSAAGRKLGVPLPTVSRKISDLEAHLNTRLLIRSTRKLSLTDAGAAYVAAARRILDEVSEAERAASGEHAAPRGDLVITAPVVFGRLHVLPVIAEFLSAMARDQCPACPRRPQSSPDRRSHRHRRAYRRACGQRFGCDAGRRGAQRGVRQPRLFRRSRRPEKAGRSGGADRGDVRSAFIVAALDLPRPKVEARTARARALAPCPSTLRKRRSTARPPASASRASCPIRLRRRSWTAAFRLSSPSMSRRPCRSASSTPATN